MKIFPVTHSLMNTGFNNNLTAKRAYTPEHRDTFVTDMPSVLNFKGLSGTGTVKQRGMLMHITSLPAHRSYCGQFLDEQTSKFIKWLKASKQTHWIMNPLNALEDNLCPYSSSGRFSRNKFIVNLNKLTGKEYGGILKSSELPDDITTPEFTLEMLEKQKNPRFTKAFSRFQKLPENTPIKQEYNAFIETNDKLWLDSYANYDAISQKFGTYWLNWDKKLQTAPEDAKAEGIPLKNKVLQILKGKISEEEYTNHLELYKFEQFLYDKQYNEFAEELNDNGIHLILDLPIGVSASGVDVWSRKNIFLLDENFKPVKVSGCPSEKAYNYTQVWGHALYDYDSPEFWDYQEASLRQLLKNADLRLDHFVGYINRAAIPTSYTKADGTVLNGYDIFKPVEQGGMGAGFFEKEWIEDISSKKSPKGENVFEIFVRIAKELGKKPENTYILEDFGPLAKTKAYKKFYTKYGKNFISQYVPIGMDICDSKNKKMCNSSNIAILTGNHDLPPLREFVDKLMDTVKNRTDKKAQAKFKVFCENELKLTPDEMNDKKAVFENLIKWHYMQNAAQVQTTLQDALGIYFRPNIPGFWNGMMDKFLMKTTPEALLSFWSRVFPKDFLERDNKSGINPGYKEAADKYTAIMKSLYPDKKA